MSLVQPAAIFRTLLPGAYWRMPASGKVVYLTFDDGPVPEITDAVVTMLGRVGAKATFFCIGKNAESHPEIIQRLLREGHSLGNHTYSHKSGWEIPKDVYIKDVDHCAQIIHSNLFRPPYGKLRPTQFFYLRKAYKIIMWDVLSMDYDTSLRPEICLAHVMKHVRPGSIVTFHDSVKAWPRLKEVLPTVLQELTAQGYTFSALFPDDFSL